MTKFKAVSLLTLLAACSGGGGGGTTEPLPALRLESVAVLPGLDTAVVSIRVNMPATVRLAYVRAGQTDSAVAQVSVVDRATVILRGLVYEQQYAVSTTATASGQQPASFPPVTFLTPAPPDPCLPAIAAGITPVDVKFEFRPQPGPDESIVLEKFDSFNCDGSSFHNFFDSIHSLDNGYTFTRIYKVRPNHPYGSDPVLLRIGLFRAGKLVRWLAPGEITLNGKRPTRISAELPAPPACRVDAACVPGPAVAFNLNRAGVVDP